MRAVHPCHLPGRLQKKYRTITDGKLQAPERKGTSSGPQEFRLLFALLRTVQVLPLLPLYLRTRIAPLVARLLAWLCAHHGVCPPPRVASQLEETVVRNRRGIRGTGPRILGAAAEARGRRDRGGQLSDSLLGALVADATTMSLDLLCTARRSSSMRTLHFRERTRRRDDGDKTFVAVSSPAFHYPRRDRVRRTVPPFSRHRGRISDPLSSSRIHRPRASKAGRQTSSPPASSTVEGTGPRGAATERRPPLLCPTGRKATGSRGQAELGGAAVAAAASKQMPKSPPTIQ